MSRTHQHSKVTHMSTRANQATRKDAYELAIAAGLTPELAREYAVSIMPEYDMRTLPRSRRSKLMIRRTNKAVRGSLRIALLNEDYDAVPKLMGRKHITTGAVS